MGTRYLTKYRVPIRVVVHRGEENMQKNHYKILISGLFILMSASGCATTRATQVEGPDLEGQVTALRNELLAKEQQVQDLQSQLESQDASLSRPSRGSSVTPESVIRVSGVSAKAVQQALLEAGFDPGPIDGRIGKKTKSAIKDFQKRNNLTADGIVGERTWALLKA